MDCSTQLIMSKDLRLRILMLENRQQIEQSKALCRSSRIRRSAIFIQPAFITNPDTMPVKSTHMGTDFGDGTTMMKNSVPGNIAARCAAMNHQQLNLSREILIFRTFHADVLQMSCTGRYPDSRNDRRCNCHNELKNILPNLLFHTILIFNSK